MKNNSYKFLATYKQVKGIFKKPHLYWYFGNWRREPNLPVWRRGNSIMLAKYGEYSETWNYAKLISSEWSDLGKKNHPILSRLFKPHYQLPFWLSFYFFNRDIVYKTKWEEDDFRYEFPAHITLVFFGYSIAVTADLPKDVDKNSYYADDYWESILTYLYYKGDLEKTNSRMGAYVHFDENNEAYRIWRFSPDFLCKESDRKALIEIQRKADLSDIFESEE